MHKNIFFPFIFFSYHSFSLSYLELQIIFPCRDIGPATATLDPRSRLWTRDRDIGPATATLDPRPRLWTHDPRPATISQTQDKVAPKKSTIQALRLVLFSPFRCCFAGSPQFSLSTVKQTKLFHSISEMFFTFLTRKNSLRKTFLLECVRSGTQQRKLQEKAGILARNSHTSVAADWTYHFSHM